jgi:hypothetical protein
MAQTHTLSHNILAIALPAGLSGLVLSGLVLVHWNRTD